jgi:diadenylate cyclase
MAEFFSFFVDNLKSFNFLTDTLDILLVTYLIYLAIKFLRQTRAAPLIKGLLFVFGVTLFANLLKMNVTSFIISSLLEFGILALIIIFQPELRALLERVGRGNVTKISTMFATESEQAAAAKREQAQMIVDAMTDMSHTKTGALIVIEGTTKLGDITKSGTMLDAAVSPELIMNIFYPKSPLHDGALILRGDRMVAAGCVLPLTQNVSLSRELGTRHRAAIGMSEAADCLVLVVSEETGRISTAQNGMLIRDLDAISLCDAIYHHIHSEDESKYSWMDKVRNWLRRKEDSDEQDS